VLSKHVVNAHPNVGIAGYRKLFGYNSLTSEDFRFNMRSMWQDHAEDGKQSTPYQRRKTCKNGHRWTAKNTAWVMVMYRGKWKMQRRCRTCERIRKRELWLRHHPLDPRLCENPKCGEVYQPVRAFQMYCSKRCCQQVAHSRRSTTRAGRAAKQRRAL